MLLLVGLGNPGPKYERNRHNVGFMAVDEIVRRHSFSPWRARFNAQVAEATVAGRKVIVMKPMTFMNESGRAVGEAARFYKLKAREIFVFYDELDLAAAKLRFKTGGGHAGHNGLRSIDQHLGNEIGNGFHKIRIGIGHPGDKAKVLGHVLGDFSKQEWPDFEALLGAMADAVPDLITRGGADFTTKVALLLRPPENAQRKGGQGGDAPGENTRQDAARDGAKPATGDMDNALAAAMKKVGLVPPGRDKE